MNFLFNNKQKTLQNDNTEQNIDVPNVFECDNFSSAISNLTGEMVLVLKSCVGNLTTQALIKRDYNRLQPFYSNSVKELNLNSHKAELGYSVAKNQTFNMQVNATRQAKLIYLNYIVFLKQINSLISHAPNIEVKNALSGLRQETIISIGVMANIIKVVSNNQNAILEEVGTQNSNAAFCNELKNAMRTNNLIIFGLIKLNRLIEIPQISNQLLILTLSANNNQNLLQTLKSYC